MIDKGIFNLLSQGYTCVTPTRRLSRYLLYRYAALQIEVGHQAWSTPDCLPWTTWCQRLWQEHTLQTESSPLLINRYQQQCLWQQVIERSSYAKQLLQVATTVKQAMAAYELCQSYDIVIYPEDIYLNEDTRAFRDWAGAYHRQLQDNHFQDETGLPGVLSEKIPAAKARQRKIVCYGFDSITPQQQKLINALKLAGDEIIVYELPDNNESIQVHRATDVRSEIGQLAQWCRGELLNNPRTSIGVICPNLSVMRQAFVQQFDEVLAPESLLNFNASYDRAYNISLGRPLVDYPLIHTAVNVLQLGLQRISLHTLSALLRSSFIAGARMEFNQRACFDAFLREPGETHLNLKTVFRLAEQAKRYQQCPGFVEQLKAFDMRYLSTARQQGPGTWARTFSDLLKQFGWPGERPLNSDEYQTLEAWQDSLHQMASLDPVIPSMTYAMALAQLLRIIGDTSFQPQTSEAPVQIMGVTGSAAMQFDILWFTGCHDQAWPPNQAANPFIPHSLQREKGIPSASAELQLAHTQQLTRQLVNSARHCVISYPAQDQDRVLRLSPVVLPFTTAASELEIVPVPGYQAALFDSRRLESFIDDLAPAIPAGEAARGGSSLFRDQSLCPFRAFARHRLFAEGLQSIDTGLNPAERGQLVHEAMQNFWLRTRNSETLHAYTELELANTIRSAITQTIKQFSKRHPETLSEQFIRLEQQRLTRLLQEWLKLELERPGFTIREAEQWHNLEFGNIRIRMRIDRIDELADGRVVIIDYKTGQVNVNDWLDERPADPQLPLYAVTLEGEVAALVYARVKYGNCRFEGLSAEVDLIPQVKSLTGPDWESQIENWRTVLTRLAGEFREGQAMVAPSSDRACRQCDLHGFCRIHERIAVFTEMEAYE